MELLGKDTRFVQRAFRCRDHGRVYSIRSLVELAKDPDKDEISWSIDSTELLDAPEDWSQRKPNKQRTGPNGTTLDLDAFYKDRRWSNLGSTSIPMSSFPPKGKEKPREGVPPLNPLMVWEYEGMVRARERAEKASKELRVPATVTRVPNPKRVGGEFIRDHGRGENTHSELVLAPVADTWEEMDSNSKDVYERVVEPPEAKKPVGRPKLNNENPFAVKTARMDYEEFLGWSTNTLEFKDGRPRKDRDLQERVQQDCLAYVTYFLRTDKDFKRRAPILAKALNCSESKIARLSKRGREITDAVLPHTSTRTFQNASDLVHFFYKISPQGGNDSPQACESALSDSAGLPAS